MAPVKTTPAINLSPVSTLTAIKLFFGQISAASAYTLKFGQKNSVYCNPIPSKRNMEKLSVSLIAGVVDTGVFA
jgi:hypothetical protein